MTRRPLGPGPKVSATTADRPWTRDRPVVPRQAVFLLWYLRHIRRTAHDIPWIHLAVGAIGNLAFVVGSLMFLSPEWTRTGTWLFVVASWGMLIGVLGEIAARYEGRVRAREAATAART